MSVAPEDLHHVERLASTAAAELNTKALGEVADKLLEMWIHYHLVSPVQELAVGREIVDADNAPVLVIDVEVVAEVISEKIGGEEPLVRTRLDGVHRVMNNLRLEQLSNCVKTLLLLPGIIHLLDGLRLRSSSVLLLARSRQRVLAHLLGEGHARGGISGHLYCVGVGGGGRRLAVCCSRFVNKNKNENQFFIFSIQKFYKSFSSINIISILISLNISIEISNDSFQ